MLDQFWTGFLDWTEDLLEGIHLRRLGKKEPLVEYSSDTYKRFTEGLEEAVEKTIDIINSFRLDSAIVEAEKKRNGSTWTYLIDDNSFPSFTMALLGMDNAVAAVTGMMLVVFSPVLLLKLIYEKIKGYIKKS